MHRLRGCTECADAQADLRFCWAYISFCRFCRAEAQWKLNMWSLIFQLTHGHLHREKDLSKISQQNQFRLTQQKYLEGVIADQTVTGAKHNIIGWWINNPGICFPTVITVEITVYCFASLKIPITPQPLYNMVYYNMVLDITRIRVGPQMAIYDSFSYISRLVTKPTKWHIRPAKTQISTGIRPVWSESLMSAWKSLGP